MDPRPNGILNSNIISEFADGIQVSKEPDETKTPESVFKLIDRLEKKCNRLERVLELISNKIPFESLTYDDDGNLDYNSLMEYMENLSDKYFELTLENRDLKEQVEDLQSAVDSDIPEDLVEWQTEEVLKELCVICGIDYEENRGFNNLVNVKNRLKGRVVPVGIQWPTFPDGTPVNMDDPFLTGLGTTEYVKYVSIYPVRGSNCSNNRWVETSCEIGYREPTDEATGVLVFPNSGEHVLRPSDRYPSVRDMDGLPIRIGEVVYYYEHFESDPVALEVSGWDEEHVYVYATEEELKEEPFVTERDYPAELCTHFNRETNINDIDIIMNDLRKLMQNQDTFSKEYIKEHIGPDYEVKDKRVRVEACMQDLSRRISWADRTNKIDQYEEFMKRYDPIAEESGEESNE